MVSKHRHRLVFTALTSLLIVSCAARGDHGLRQTKAVWHGFDSCTTGIEDLPYGWDASSRHFPPNYDKNVAVWVYVTVCKSGWGFGPQKPVGYQVVFYNPSYPVLFDLEGDKLQKYLAENTALSVDTTDIKSYSPIVTNPGKLTAYVHDADRAALKRDLEIIIHCASACDPGKVTVRRREWNGAKVYMFLWDVSGHEI